eukprot:1441933-Pleurochrysis_carterae.AAC.1
MHKSSVKSLALLHVCAPPRTHRPPKSLRSARRRRLEQRAESRERLPPPTDPPARYLKGERLAEELLNCPSTVPVGSTDAERCGEACARGGKASSAPSTRGQARVRVRTLALLRVANSRMANREPRTWTVHNALARTSHFARLIALARYVLPACSDSHQRARRALPKRAASLHAAANPPRASNDPSSLRETLCVTMRMHGMER